MKGQRFLVRIFVWFALVSLIFAAFLMVAPVHLGGEFDYEYLVQPGDTLFSIANRFGVTQERLAQANGIGSSPSYRIQAGEYIVIPLYSKNVKYITQENDTIWKIAKEFEVYWVRIAQSNNIVFPYLISSGEILTITLSNDLPLSERSILANEAIPSGSSSSSFLLTRSSSPSQSSGSSSLGSSSLTESTITSSGSKEGSSSSSSSSSSSTTTYSITSKSSDTTVTTSSSTGRSPRQAWVWVFGQYPQAQMNTVKEHSSNLSAVSPMEFFLSNNGSFSITDGSGNHYNNLCPEIQSYGLGCYPLVQNDQNNCTGLSTLLGNFTLQQEFISYTVKYAGEYGAQGINLDFEPSNNCGNAVVYATFVTDLADALHENSMTLSVDVASFDGGNLWNFVLLGEGDADVILTMDTYNTPFNASNCNFQWAGSSFMCGFSKMYAEVPTGKIAIGLITQIDDSDLGKRFGEIDLYSTPYVIVWPYAGNPIQDQYWNSFGDYLSGKT